MTIYLVELLSNTDCSTLWIKDKAIGFTSKAKAVKCYSKLLEELGEGAARHANIREIEVSTVNATIEIEDIDVSYLEKFLKK